MKAYIDKEEEYRQEQILQINNELEKLEKLEKLGYNSKAIFNDYSDTAWSKMHEIPYFKLRLIYNYLWGFYYGLTRERLYRK